MTLLGLLTKVGSVGRVHLLIALVMFFDIHYRDISDGPASIYIA